MRTNDARNGLLIALDLLLTRDSIENLSIREVARVAKVSHALPAYYFGDKRGLLTAFAADGFRLLSRAMVERSAHVPKDQYHLQLAAVGQAYIEFGSSNPNRFRIMFHYDDLNHDDPDLVHFGKVAFESLLGCVTAYYSKAGQKANKRQTILAAWALVHGLTMLSMGPRHHSRVPANDRGATIKSITSEFARRFLPPTKRRRSKSQ
jgi:AcrR family transcriptional regulator